MESNQKSKAIPNNSKSRSVIILGAGPAGLFSAYELVTKKYKITILEMDPKYVGGISRTVKYKNYRFDIGGHRFFSKNQFIMDWWSKMLGEDFMKRPRLSRWYYEGKFFNYPIKPSEMLRVFGLYKAIRIVTSYFRYKFFPIKPEKNLSDWCINNFGNFLAQPFFIKYNLKLWGIDPKYISKDFTQQRIKGLSFTATLRDVLMKKINKNKTVSKSLISTFNYPKYGPGQMWEKVANSIVKLGGKIELNRRVTNIEHSRNGFVISTVDSAGKIYKYRSDYVLSSIPLKQLVQILEPAPEEAVLEAAENLKFRDFITVALVVNRRDLPKDNWIYTHDKGIKAIRIQLFHNWSPYMVPSDDLACIGFEYVTSVDEELWGMNDNELISLAKKELTQLSLQKKITIHDSKVVKMKNVYPRYDLGYDKQVETIKSYLKETFPNNELQPMGRGGLHRYNNSDHSMMTAFLAVENIVKNTNHDQWKVNSDAEYHEEEKV